MVTNPDRARILEQNRQLALIRRLREEEARKHEDHKLAKERRARAERDLETLCDDRGQQDLFAGALILDKKTGEIVDYRGVGEEVENPAAKSSEVREALQGLKDVANESGLSIELSAGKGRSKKSARIEPEPKS